MKFTELFHGQLDETRRFCTWLEDNGMLEEKMGARRSAERADLHDARLPPAQPEKMNTLNGRADPRASTRRGWLATDVFPSAVAAALAGAFEDDPQPA